MGKKRWGTSVISRQRLLLRLINEELVHQDEHLSPFERTQLESMRRGIKKTIKMTENGTGKMHKKRTE